MVCAYDAIPRANVETSEVAKNRAQHTLTDGGRLYAVLCTLFSVLSTLYSTLAPIPLKTLDVFFN